MTTRPLLLLASLSLTLLLGACVSTQTKDSLAGAMASHKVSPATVKKVQAGDSLSAEEMAATLKAGVPEAPLLSYVKQTGGLYSISARQINLLSSSGASDAFIDYLLETQRLHDQQMENLSNPPGYYNGYNSPYYYQPLPRPPCPAPRPHSSKR
jgi:hypothetical protein